MATPPDPQPADPSATPDDTAPHAAADPLAAEPGVPTESAPDLPGPSTADDARPTPGLWSSLAAGFMLVAGILHLYVVDVHMSHARGVGIFFLGIGIAQIVWAVVFLRAPDRRLARFGFAALVIMPTLLYVATRFIRAPWSLGPEAVDVIGVTTQIAQLAAGASMLVLWRPTLPSLRVGEAVVVGCLLAVAGYSGAIASEDVPWLAAPDDIHGHEAGAHGGHGAHDDHGDGHGAHSSNVIGIRGQSIIGTVGYYGPQTGQAIDQHCRAIGQANEDCWLYYLQDRLVADGSVVAFDMLEELMAVNSVADGESHALAHVLGHAAYQGYGLDIQLTLAECSYDVFQGCLHGALQAYFSDLSSQGLTLNADTIRVPCAYGETRFEIYSCIHGIGHGVMIHADYDLHASLDLCNLLDTHFQRSSCWGGAYMENVVAYLDSRKPDYVPHTHDGELPEFWVDSEDLAYPCNVVKDAYARDCWRMQTSLILHFNGGDFEDASRICDEEAGSGRLDCYNSLGRDAAPYGNRDPATMSRMCSYGAPDAHDACVRSFTSGIILQANDPKAGLTLCEQLPEQDKEPCYQDTGRQSMSFYGEDGSATFCDVVPEPYRPQCESGRTG